MFLVLIYVHGGIGSGVCQSSQESVSQVRSQGWRDSHQQRSQDFHEVQSMENLSKFRVYLMQGSIFFVSFFLAKTNKDFTIGNLIQQSQEADAELVDRSSLRQFRQISFVISAQVIQNCIWKSKVSNSNK